MEPKYRITKLGDINLFVKTEPRSPLVQGLPPNITSTFVFRDEELYEIMEFLKNYGEQTK